MVLLLATTLMEMLSLDRQQACRAIRWATHVIEGGS